MKLLQFVQCTAELRIEYGIEYSQSLNINTREIIFLEGNSFSSFEVKQNFKTKFVNV